MRRHCRCLRLFGLIGLLIAGSVASAASSGYVATEFSGTIIDAETKRPLWHAVIQASVYDARNRQLSTKRIQSAGGNFSIPDWKRAPGKDLIVRIYAAGYRRLIVKNPGAGKDVGALSAAPANGVGRTLFAMTPLPDKKGALANEIARWKKDLETGIGRPASKDRNEAIQKHEKLLFLFDAQCKTLSEAERKRLCYSANSELGRYVASAMVERNRFLVIEESDGRIVKMPLKAVEKQAVVVVPVQADAHSSADTSPKQGYASGLARPVQGEPLPAK